MTFPALALLALSGFATSEASTIAQQTGQGPRPTAAVKASRMLDVRTGNYVNNAVILISGERIVSVGSNLSIPSGVPVTDLGNATVLPGFIDSHTHLLQNYTPGQGDDNNMVRTVVQMGNTKRALLGAKMGQEMLEAGITTARDLGNSGWGGDVALRDAINAGSVQGPRIVASTRALSAAGGQFGWIAPEAQHLIAQEYIAVSGVEEARKAVRQAFYDGADLIKVIVNTGPRVLTVEEMKAIVEEARRVGKKVAAHATDPNSTRIAVDAGVDSIEHGYTINDDVLADMATKKIFLVPTDSTAEHYTNMGSAGRTAEENRIALERNRARNQRQADRVQRAIKAGVRIAAGSDTYYQSPNKTRGISSLDMLLAYSSYGMSNIEVIRSATLNAADLIGSRVPVGVLEPGRFADLVAFEGDPLTDIKEVLRSKFVMKGGVVIKNELKK